MEIPIKNNRNSECHVYVGFPGSGKTYLMQLMVDLEVSSRKGRALIITPDPFEWKHYPLINLQDPDCFKKINSPTRLIYNDPSDIDRIADEYDGFFDGLLLFDDCREYVASNVQQSFRTLIRRRRHRSHDIIAAGQGFSEIPPIFFMLANRYVLFYTQDNVAKRKEEFGIYYEPVKQAVIDVNKESLTNKHAKKIINARPNV